MEKRCAQYYFYIYWSQYLGTAISIIAIGHCRLNFFVLVLLCSIADTTLILLAIY